MTEEFHSLLPYAVQRDLMAAARVEPTALPGESLARIHAIDTATWRARLHHPELFITPRPRVHYTQRQRAVTFRGDGFIRRENIE